MRADKIINRIMLALLLIYCILFAVFFLLSLDDAWALFAIGVMAVLAAPAFIALQVILLYLRYRFRRRSAANQNSPLAAFAHTWALASALITLALTAAYIVISNMDIAPPFSAAYLSSRLTAMMLAFGALTLVPLLIGRIFGWLMRRNAASPKRISRLRGTAILLCALIFVGVLFVPQPAGSYNDGGSRIYEAVLYEAVDWNRTQHFDGTPRPEEEQHLRVYFFPFNCYTYTAKWDLMH